MPAEKTKNDKLKAFINITIDESFCITGLRLIESEKGLFVSMPARKTNTHEYKDTVYPITKECNDYVQKTVIEAYKKYTESAENE